MEIIRGELEVALAGGAGGKAMKAGETFEVPANGKFYMVVKNADRLLLLFHRFIDSTLSFIRGRGRMGLNPLREILQPRLPLL